MKCFFARPAASFAAKGRRCFTVIELLVVVAIMTVITLMAAPALPSLMGSGQLNKTLSQIGGMFELARSYAVAQNTCVWVAFSPTVDEHQINQLAMAVIASKDGTNPVAWSGNAMPVPSDSLFLISPIKTFSQIALEPAGTYANPLIRSMTNAIGPVSQSANGLSSAATFQIRLPGHSSPTVFQQFIEFTPEGEARNGASPVDVVELDFKPVRSASDTASKDAAVMQINGITGQNTVYRK